MRNENGNGLFDYTWGFTTLVAIASVVIAIAYFSGAR